MSNFSDLDEAIHVTQGSNLSALKIIGATIGTIADFAGAVGAITSAIQLVQSLTGNGDQTQALLQNILTTIQAEFHKLNLDLKAEDLLA